MSFLRSSINSLLIMRVINREPFQSQTRYVKRWVAPALRELRKRANKIGQQEPQPRSGFVEWNYRAELFAFGKRLHEQFDIPMLQTAFTQQAYILKEQQKQRELGIENDDLQMSDNRNLAMRGEQLAKQYVEEYIKHTLPKVPTEGRNAFVSYLLSTSTLAHIASYLGMKDLIFSAEYPPSPESYAHSLLAVIAALEKSSGVEKAFLFVRDFICTQLNQRDLLELWTIEQPEKLLNEICKERQLPEPEPRLIGDCGKNTVLATYHVGIYCAERMIGKGFGEDIPTAVKTASLDALQTLFEISDNMRPFDFQLQVEPKNIQLTQNRS